MHTPDSRHLLLAALLSGLLSTACFAGEPEADDTKTAAPSTEIWLQPATKSSGEGGGAGLAARLLRGGNSYTIESSFYTDCLMFCPLQDGDYGDTSSLSLLRGSYTRRGRAVYGYEYGVAYIERESGRSRETYEGFGLPLKVTATLDGYVIGVGLSVELMLAEEPYVAAGMVIPMGKLW